MRWKETILYLLTFTMAFSFLSGLQFSTPYALDADAYYHITIARAMRESIIIRDFAWLRGSFPPGGFADLQFLYHAILIPFTLFPGAFGIKLAQTLFTTLAVLMVHHLLRTHRVRYASLWTGLLLASGYGFLVRTQLSKGVMLFVLMNLLFLHAMMREKHAWTLVLAFTQTWMYPAFPILLIYSAIWSSIKALSAKRSTRGLTMTSIGIGIGLLTYPAMPNHFSALKTQIFGSILYSGIARGNEWFSLAPQRFIAHTWFALALLIIALVFFIPTLKEGIRRHTGAFTGKEHIWLYGILALSFTLLAVLSKRFIDYAPVFIILFAGTSVTSSDWEKKKRIRIMGKVFGFTAVTIALLAIIGIFSITTSYFPLRTALAHYSISPAQYEKCLNAIAAHSEAGSPVWHDEWHSFGFYYYLNQHNTYYYGLDPTFGYAYNPALYKKWIALTSGPPPDPMSIIKEDFGASYVLITSAHNLESALIAQGAQTLATDTHCSALYLP